MTNKYRTIIADDHVLFAESLKIVLSMRARDLEVVGVAYNGEDAVRLVNELEPDIVLMDVRMPTMDGVEATRIIHERHPAVKIMMLTTFSDDKYVYDAMSHGAEAYLLKDVSPNELIASIRATLNGAVLISPSVAAKVINLSHETSRRDLQSRLGPEDHGRQLFSERDRRILKLIAEGFDNRTIAERLFLAEQTVKNRVSDIYSRLGVHNRIQAIKMLGDSLGPQPDRKDETL